MYHFNLYRIQKNHAYIKNIENNKISLKIVDEESKVLVNGKEVEKTGVELHHNDRFTKKIKKEQNFMTFN